MAAIRDRHDPLRIMGRRLIILALAILVVSALWGVWNVYRKERESAVEGVRAQTQLSELQKQQAQLQRDLDSLKSDRGMEAALRNQYGMGKQGEGMVVIVEPPTSTPVQATSSMKEWFKDFLSKL